MAFLLDTNVLSELRKGIELLRPKAPDQADALGRWLERLLAHHTDSILPVDEGIAQRWGRLEAARSLPVIDGLLAATALETGLTLATRNVKDFRDTGVTLVNPFA